MTRRGFYESSIFALAAAINIAMAVPSLAYLLLSKKAKSATGWTDASSLSALPTGTPTRVRIHRERQDAWKKSVEELTVWAVKKSDSDVVVYSPQCTHLGCGYRWVEEDKEFFCPCHDSGFGIDGQVLRGPAPRPLDRFQTRIEGDRLWLGTIEQTQE